MNFRLLLPYENALRGFTLGKSLILDVIKENAIGCQEFLLGPDILRGLVF